MLLGHAEWSLHSASALAPMAAAVTASQSSTSITATLVQAGILPPQAELVRGDVYQFSTLERALEDSNVMLIAIGSRPALDPFGPFNIDFQVYQISLIYSVAFRHGRGD